MPSIETAFRYQDAVYWAANGYDDYGEPKLDAAVDLKVRWEDVKDEVVDAKGNTVAIDAIAVIDRDIPVGSVLWQGTIADIPGTSETPSSDLRRVLKFSSIPDIKNRNYRRLVYLRRLSDELPALA